jgi:hypothetical protein
MCPNAAVTWRDMVAYEVMTADTCDMMMVVRLGPPPGGVIPKCEISNQFSCVVAVLAGTPTPVRDTIRYSGRTTTGPRRRGIRPMM